MADLPWSKPFRRRCYARVLPNETGFWGRCELQKHGSEYMHILERGMVWIRWADAPLHLTSPKYIKKLEDE